MGYKIEFFNISGLDEINIPYFDSEINRDNYFDTLVYKVADIEAYYPPYYNNYIKVDTDDVSFNDIVNYVRILFEDRYYYYFIRDIQYINENIIGFSLRLDTITTYMFDIFIESCLIKRKHINRWIKNSNGTYKINRNYIRDRITKSELFIEDSFEMSYPHSSSNLLKFSEEDKADGIELLFNEYKYENNNNGFHLLALGSGYQYVQAPFCKVNGKTDSCLRGIYFDNEEITYKDSVDNHVIAFATNFGCMHDGMLGFMLSHKAISQAYYFPFNPNISGVNVKYRNDILDIFIDYSVLEYGSGHSIELGYYQLNLEGWFTGVGCTGDYCLLPYSYKEDNRFKVYNRTTTDQQSLNSIYDFGFVVNTSINQLYNSYLIPQMFDENYIQVLYGEREQLGSFPLSKMEDTNFKLCRGFDFLSGARYYYVLLNNQENDKYDTLNICAEPISYSLMYDEWANTSGANKYRLLMSTLSHVYNIGEKVITSSIGGFSAANAILDKSSNYDKRYTKQEAPLRVKPQREYNTLMKDTSLGLATSTNNEVIEMSKDYANFCLNYVNNNDTRGNGIAGLYSGHDKTSYYTMIKTLKVNDFETCAFYYHCNGNLVNEPMYQGKFLGTLFYNNFTRYYFNYFQLVDCIISLSCINHEVIVEDIKRRLYNGIRCWNIEHTSIGNYRMDNVEVSLRR